VARGHGAASGPRFPDAWRAVLDRAAGGLGWPVSATPQSRRRDLISRAQAPLAARHCRVAVLSLKGGVGKTSTTIGLGSALAWLRQDRIIAIDASPDRGTLSDRVALDTPATVRDLLSHRDRLGSYRDVRAFTSKADSGLEILGSDRDPAASVAFGADDYASVCSVVEQHYAICLTDCATGLLNSAMYGVLSGADQIVLVSSLTADGARSAGATLDWLAAHAHGNLAGEAVVVLCAVRPGRRATAESGDIEAHFAARCRAVTRIPYDPHLAEGTVVSWDRLSRGTTDGYLALAALVIDRLSGPGQP
jgi:MinD-like ATPase involved in chromosome partitioning or flagellar assembly